MNKIQTRSELSLADSPWLTCRNPKSCGTTKHIFVDIEKDGDRLIYHCSKCDFPRFWGYAGLEPSTRGKAKS